MNHTFTFETNLNDIFAGDDIAKSEKSCDYCLKRKRVCRCDTIRRELGSEDAAEIAELQERKRYYDEICDKIVDKYKDVVNRFEYDKDIVSYIKKNKINDEVECEDWIYFYELLKERKIVEKCIDTKSSREEPLTLNSFHFDEEANFISSLNYYLKVHKLHHVIHNWMGMSVNPFDEYASGGGHHAGMGDSCDGGGSGGDGGGGAGGGGYGGNGNGVSAYGGASDQAHAKREWQSGSTHVGQADGEDNRGRDTLTPIALEKEKKFHPLYYYLYMQENEKWISGLNNSGSIIHPENITHVWNQTVRESNKKVKLFRLITANSVSTDDVMNYCKKEKKNQHMMEQNSHAARIRSISQLVCALGMVDIGGCFIMKIKLFFDNFLLSVFSILAICFKKLEVYRPSCCHLRNVVFLVGVHFNGITSIFLSSLNNWVQGAQREIASLPGEGSQLAKQGTLAAQGMSAAQSTIAAQSMSAAQSTIAAQGRNTPDDAAGGVKTGGSFRGKSIIPRKWINKNFFREYQKCIHHFVDYLIYYLKKCINVSNTNLMKKNIENTKRMYLSQFFEEHRLVDIRKKDKLLFRLLDDLYLDQGRIIPRVYHAGGEDGADQADRADRADRADHANRADRADHANRADHPNHANQLDGTDERDVLCEGDRRGCFTDFPYAGAPFSKKELQKLRSSLQLPPQAGRERGIFFEGTGESNETRENISNGVFSNRGGNVHKYRKQITALLRRIDFKGDKTSSRKRRASRINRVDGTPGGLFQLDEDLIRKRVFSVDKTLLERHESEFEGLLKKQAYFTNKNWFRCYLQKDAYDFVNPFYLGKELYRDILLSRNHIYYNNCDVEMNSLKQILKRYEPVCSSYVMDGQELCCSVIDCLFVLRNCAHVDLTEDSSLLRTFLVISGDASSSVFSFFSKFGTGSRVQLQGWDSQVGVSGEGSGEGGDSVRGNGSDSAGPRDGAPLLNVQELYQKKTPYKYFSEILKDKLEDQKNVCSLVFIDLNTQLFQNYVHVVEKEIKTKNYFVSSLIISFNYLQKGGSLIIHLSSAMTFFTAGLLYILVCAFERVDFFLPPSCDDLELGFYIYCDTFGGNYVYRHYVQFLWEALICNQYVEEKVPCSATTVSVNPGGEEVSTMKKKKKGDVYLSVPLFFLMNRNLVNLLKRFNSFYFSHHLNICMQFLREPKFFYHNRTLIKCLVTHFFRAYVLPEELGRSFGRVFKSVSIHCDEDGSDLLDSGEDGSDLLDSGEDGSGLLDSGEDGSDLLDSGEEVKLGRNQKKNRQKVRGTTGRSRSLSRSRSSGGSGDERVANEESELHRSSSESNYSLAFEYKNIPSEISVSETAWGDSS
ncbi:hypothetical protein PCYB_021840 [Plasmodium cynomolgi strain B]|uniref:Ribosomal RNA methyltransferase FtsJ domain-containing protein n=1 Tax=Plasmodium cynomolgi (strain B) TaxID=1120755 RepID=K6URV3_PLACD|nr:hypothetical protein PCYB_021840 [Plasmodium cynomolgi strain B]GAB64615.1 hypothetical protein PCYB_021840 [Plasmodium cynomolgi strain B]